MAILSLFCRRLSFEDRLFKKRTMNPLIQRLGRFRLGRIDTNVKSDGAAKPSKKYQTGPLLRESGIVLMLLSTYLTAA